MSPTQMLALLALLAQSVVVALLVAPMPSNTMRGVVVGGLNHLWRTHSTLRSAAALSCALNAISFVTEMQRLRAFAPGLAGAPRWRVGFGGGAGAALSEAEASFREARQCDARFHAVLSGFSLFIYCIMRRLLDIQHQLYEAREVQKQRKSGGSTASRTPPDEREEKRPTRERPTLDSPRPSPSAPPAPPDYYTYATNIVEPKKDR